MFNLFAQAKICDLFHAKGLISEPAPMGRQLGIADSPLGPEPRNNR